MLLYQHPGRLRQDLKARPFALFPSERALSEVLASLPPVPFSPFDRQPDQSIPS